MKKSALAFVFTLLVSFILVSPVIAGEKKVPPSEDNLPAVGIESLQLLAFGDCFIANLGNGQVALDGSTTAQFIIDSVGVTLYLQRWTGSAWVDVNSSQSFISYNSDYVDGFSTFYVQSGYYYRAKGLHTGYNDGFPEQKESFSGYIWVD